MRRDRSGLEVLPRTECVRLLATVTMGRIGFSSGALPIILPVAFVLDEEGIVVRVHAGSQLHSAIKDAIVAFEVDDGDRWSVAVTGVAREIADVAEVRRIQDLPLVSWSRERADRFVRITLDLVSGRRATAFPSCSDWDVRPPVM